MHEFSWLNLDRNNHVLQVTKSFVHIQATMPTEKCFSTYFFRDITVQVWLYLANSFHCSQKQKRNIRYFFRLHARITVKEKKLVNTCTSFATLPLGTAVLCVKQEKFSSVFRPVWPISIHVYTYLCDDTLGRGCKFSEHGMQFVNFLHLCINNERTK